MNHTLERAWPATTIPAGNAVTLAAGEEVFVTQTLGGNVTVRTGRRLFRVANDDSGEPAGCDALKTCFEPELPVHIVDLGLVGDRAVERTPAGGHAVDVRMTLTAPGCGMGPVIAEEAREKIAALPTVESAKVHIVRDPQWMPQMISASGRKILGLA